MSNNRKNPRIKVERIINILLSDGSFVHADMIDISYCGLVIIYPMAADIGTHLKVNLTLPNHDTSVSITTKVKVIYVYFSHDDFQIGLEFEGLKEDDKKEITRFIDEKLGQKRQSQNFIVVNH